MMQEAGTSKKRRAAAAALGLLGDALDAVGSRKGQAVDSREGQAGPGPLVLVRGGGEGECELLWRTLPPPLPPPPLRKRTAATTMIRRRSGGVVRSGNQRRAWWGERAVRGGVPAADRD